MQEKVFAAVGLTMAQVIITRSEFLSSDSSNFSSRKFKVSLPLVY